MQVCCQPIEHYLLQVTPATLNLSLSCLLFLLLLATTTSAGTAADDQCRLPEHGAGRCCFKSSVAAGAMFTAGVLQAFEFGKGKGNPSNSCGELTYSAGSQAAAAAAAQAC
jgi:hypothetical protein